MADLADAVLVVEDDPTIRRLVTTTLRGGSFRVLEASGAVEGLRLARHERPRVVFLDLALGSEDGIRVCHALKEDVATRAIRVFIISARDDARTRLRAMKAGADGFFAKPFSPLALWRVVDSTFAN